MILQFFPTVCRKFLRDFELFIIDTAQGQLQTVGRGLGCPFCAFKETHGGRQKTVKEVPIWEKSNLSLEEAAAYSGIGINKLRELTNEKDCRFVLWVGNKRLIKRRLFDQYIEQEYSI